MRKENSAFRQKKAWTLAVTDLSHQQGWDVYSACRFFAHSRQAYYKASQLRHQRAPKQQEILSAVRDIRTDDPSIGGVKLWHLLKGIFHEGLGGRDSFLKLLKENHLTTPRKWRMHTTNSRHSYRKYPNLIKELEVVHANQVWVSDITYIKISNSILYLHLVTDLYSRRIMGYDLAPNLRSEHSMKALEQAIATAGPEELSGSIHHSDRGCQYCSYSYTDRLKELGMQISMTEDSNPIDNAVAERINGIIKDALEEQFLTCTTPNEAQKRLDTFIHHYNTRRPHMSLGNHTPLKAYEEVGAQKRLWKGRKPKESNTFTPPNDPPPSPHSLIHPQTTPPPTIIAHK